MSLGFKLSMATGMVMSVAGCVVLAIAAPGQASAGAGFGSYAVTIDANAITTDGDVGASGGLVALDSGQASVSGRLDSTPSAAMAATPTRPGSLAETIIGQVNSEGVKSIQAPQAQANYPGDGHGSLQTVKPTKAGPFAVQGGNADATATKDSMDGTATGQASSVFGVYSSGSATAAGQAAVTGSAGAGTIKATTTVSSVTVGGVLTLRNVDASAAISVSPGSRKVTADVTVGGASVNGQAVSIGSGGVTAIGHGLLPGQTTASLTRKADAALKAAEISVHAIAAVHSSHGRSSYADTGGIEITTATPSLPAGVAANEFTMTLGSIVLTETDSAPIPGYSPPPTTPTSSPTTRAPTSTHQSTSRPIVTHTEIVGPPAGTGGLGGGSKPLVASSAPAPQSGTVELTSGGLTHDELLAAFAGWQFLSLMTPTLYALASTRRRRDFKAPR